MGKVRKIPRTRGDTTILIPILINFMSYGIYKWYCRDGHFEIYSIEDTCSLYIYLSVVSGNNYSQNCVKRPYKTRYAVGLSDRWLLIGTAGAFCTTFIQQ